MRVVGFAAENMASSHLRVKAWINALKERGHEGFYYSDGFDDINQFDEKVNGADVVVYGRTHNARHVAALQAGRKLYGYKLIVDTDDLVTAIPDYSFASQHYHSATGVVRIAEAQYRMADAVTVSTEFLRDKTVEYNPSTYYIPNCADMDLWNDVRYRQKEERHRNDIRIYWGGGGGHWNDLLIVKEATLRIYHEYPQTKFIFSNFVPDWMAALDPQRIFFLPLVPFGSFCRVLTWLCNDIALAPLELNDFNRAKSNVKYLDYAMAEVAGIYQEIEAYKCVEGGNNGLLATTPEDWYKRMKTLIDSPSLRADIARRAKEDVLSRWTLYSHVGTYERMLERVVKMPRIEVKPLIEGSPVEAQCLMS